MDNIAELLRLVHNLIRLGAVAEVDTESARVRVAIGELETNWLPWLELRAGTTRTWNPPTVGEQVLVLAMGGDLNTAVALTGIYSDTHPAPSASAAKDHTVYPDGAVIEYDHKQHHLKATIPGSVQLDADSTVKVTAGDAITAKTQASATVHADQDITVDAGGNITAQAGGDIKATAANIKATAQTAAKVTAPAITLTGNVTVTGNLSLGGSLSMGAGQSADIAADASFSGALTSNGKDISASHKHKGVKPGSGKSGPVA
jgi:phage baseplate assembly protein V